VKILSYGFTVVFVASSLLSCSKSKNNLKQERKKTKQEYYRLLKSRKAIERSEAILELTLEKDKKYDRIFIYLLENDPVSFVRVTSAIALAKRRVYKAKDKILELLHNKSLYSKRNDLIYALGLLKSKKAVPDIIPELFSTSFQSQLNAVKALESIKPRSLFFQVMSYYHRCQSKSQVKIKKQYLCPKINKDKAKIDKILLELFAKIKDKNSINYVQKVFNHQRKKYKNKRKYSASTLAASIFALGHLGVRGYAVKILSFISHNSPAVQEQSKTSEILLRNPRVLPKLYKYFRYFHSKTSLYATEIFLAIAPKYKVSDIVKLLQENTNKMDVSLATICRKWQISQCHNLIEKKLIEGNKFAKKEGRKELALALGKIGNQRSMLLLRRILLEKDGDGRYGAALALAEKNDRESLEVIHRLLRQTADKEFKLMLVLALQEFADVSSVTILNEILEQEQNLSLWIFPALLNIKSKKARSLVEHYLFDDNPFYANTAFLAYSHLKDSQSLLVLQKLLKRLNTSIKNYAKKTRTIIKLMKNISKLNLDSKKSWIKYNFSDFKPSS